MALIPKAQINSFPYDTKGLSFEVIDITGDYNATTNTGGFGSPNPTRGSITMTQFLISQYEFAQSQGVASSGTYQAKNVYVNETSGNITFDGALKTAKTNVEFIPYVSEAFSSDRLQTGQYIQNDTYLPTTSTSSFLVQNTDMNLGLGATDVIPDGAYNGLYKLFGGSAVASGDLVDGVEYCVLGGTITISDTSQQVYGTFDAKQTFICATDDATFTVVSGSPLLYPLIAFTQFDFLIFYTSLKNLNEINRLEASNKCKCGSDFTTKYATYKRWYDQYLSLVSPLNDSPLLANSLKDKMLNLYEEIITCYCS